jgi:UDP-N-acetylmuramoyl-tripeptide--D-alanyl-D-alanine ligase
MIERDTFSAAEVMSGESLNGKGVFKNFATDSRSVEKGDLFICIKGERTDGHKYVQGAVDRGAGAILCSEPINVDIPCIRVDDTVTALQKLALNHRERSSAIVVGITGSVGKTTTKEFTYAVFSSKYKTHKTQGNKNSETGRPITVLGIEPDDGACIAEMGMSGLGEISVLTRIAKPDIAIITNVGYSHIEHLKTRENIRKAKLEIIEGLEPDGVLILNGDDDMLSSCENAFKKVIFFGIDNDICNVRAVDIEQSSDSMSYRVVYGDKSFSVTLPVSGIHYVYDSLAAVSAALYAGLSEDEIRRGLLNFEGAAGRQKVYTEKGVTIIDDTYNAVPASMKAAFGLLRNLDCDGRRIAVIGDMLELGEYSSRLHYEVGEALSGIDAVIAYGSFADDYIRGAKAAGLSENNIFMARDTSHAAEILSSLAVEGDGILFKASRGMHAEEVIQGFLA